MNVHSYFFLTDKVSRGTDYDDGYIMIDQQTQTVTTCNCYEKGKVYGRTWDDDVVQMKKYAYKLEDVKERAKTVKYSNPIYIPTGKDRDRLR